MLYKEECEKAMDWFYEKVYEYNDFSDEAYKNAFIIEELIKEYFKLIKTDNQ